MPAPLGTSESPVMASKLCPDTDHPKWSMDRVGAPRLRRAVAVTM
jgi:hypothetical protein